MKVQLRRAHPISLFIYFLGMFLVIMFARHPFMVAVQTFAVVCIYLRETPKKRTILNYLWIVVFMVVTNGIFVHRGVTVLLQHGWFRVTLESILYGLQYGLIFMDILLVFAIMHRYITREHWIYLLGSLWPSFGMLMAMVEGLLPKYQRQGKEIWKSNQRLMKGSILARGIHCFSAETTWAFETSMDQVDSMNARGYGCGKRTHFHRFIFHKTDGVWIGICLILFSLNLFAYRQTYGRFYFYPMIILAPLKPMDGFWMAAMFLQLVWPWLKKGGDNVSNS